jgi:hypothetical protein
MKKYRILFSLILVMGLLVGTFGFVSADETEPEEEETTTTEVQNPVVGFINQLPGMEDVDVQALQDEGFGLGEIAKLYHLLTYQLEEGEVLALTTEELLVILNEAKDMGWGEYYKENLLHPGLQGGIGWLFKKANQMQLEEGETFRNGKPDKEVGPPEHANNDKDKVKGPKK